MRVIGGEFRSRRLKTLPGLETRPTPDRLRETLFDVLAPRIAGATFLDVYAGTGAVGIEALSRGARFATFLEKSRRAVQVIRENLAALGLSGRAEVVPGAVLSSLAGRHADIVFLDPPYSLEREYAAALEILGKDPPPLVVAQHPTHFSLEAHYGNLACTRRLRQGDNVLAFFSPQPSF